MRETHQIWQHVYHIRLFFLRCNIIKQDAITVRVKLFFCKISTSTVLKRINRGGSNKSYEQAFIILAQLLLSYQSVQKIKPLKNDTKVASLCSQLICKQTNEPIVAHQ